MEIHLAPYGINPQTKLGYPPNPTQRRVLEWVDKHRSNPVSETIPILYLQGGVGSGKSRAMMAVVMEMLLEIPSLRVLWVRQDLKDLKLSIQDKFFDIFPQELVARRDGTYNFYELKQVGGTTSRIYFNGAKDIGGFGSQEFGVIAITEAHELVEIAYRALKRRCRQENVANMILMESEAPNEGHWLANVTNPAHENYDADIKQWEVSTYENWQNLPLAYRGSLERMPDAWKRKYLFGRYGFIPAGTPYYSGFKEIMHAGEYEWNQYKELILGWDFGFHHPACLVTQVDMQDRWVWLREIIGTDITINNFAEYVKERLNRYYPNCQTISYGDPAVTQKNDKSEQTSWEILQHKGFTIQYKVSTYRERKEIIERKMATLVRGKPSLLVDRRYCKVAVDGFLGGYHYPIQKTGQEYGQKMEMPFKDGFYEHIMNAGEYIAVHLFRPVQEKRKRYQEAGFAGISNI